MPPRSRGKASSGAGPTCQLTAASTVAAASQRTHDERREQQRRTRARNASLIMQDPLTLLITLVTYPLLIVALGLLHVGYYVVLKARASQRLSRSAAAIQQPPWSRRRRRRGMSYAARCDEDANARIYARSLQVNHPPCKLALDKKSAKTATSVIPAHVALAIGAKPARTSLLLGRIAMLPFRTRTEEGAAASIAYDTEQESFALLSMRSAVRCCAIAGIETLTVFDERGYLADAFRDSHKTRLDDDIIVEGPSLASVHGKAEEPAEPNAMPSSIPMRIEATIIRPFQQKGNTADAHTNKNGSVVSTDADETIVRRICIYVLDPHDAEGALARTASHIADQRRKDGGEMSATKALKITPEQLSDVLRANDYPSDPDLLVIHGGANQVSLLHGFPPWLVRLCEIYHDVDSSPYAPLSPSSFERALYAYSRSEQRHGK